MAHWSKGPNREATLRKIKKTQFKKRQRASKQTEFKKGDKPWNAGTKPYTEFVCEECHKTARRPARQVTGGDAFRFCSVECWTQYRTKNGLTKGDKHQSWKGGKVRMGRYSEYVGIYAPDHPSFPKTRYVLEHRFVMENSLGRLLRQDETVHHINGIQDDNRIENLQLRHGRHGTGQAYVCLDCGSHNVGPVLIKE